jgi:hypothetical protein
MAKYQLQIQNLELRHPGVSKGVAASYYEAASVCLHRHHVSPKDFILRRISEAQAIASWQEPDERLLRAWANEIDATESGAYCMALAAVEITDNLVAVARAETRTGADYYLAPIGEDIADLESSHRLEVSGIDQGPDSGVEVRLRQKIKQAIAGNSNLPAIAAVVSFSGGVVVLADAIDK